MRTELSTAKNTLELTPLIALVQLVIDEGDTFAHRFCRIAAQELKKGGKVIKGLVLVLNIEERTLAAYIRCCELYTMLLSPQLYSFSIVHYLGHSSPH